MIKIGQYHEIFFILGAVFRQTTSLGARIRIHGLTVSNIDSYSIKRPIRLKISTSRSA
jgi:hypothetical protein